MSSTQGPITIGVTCFSADDLGVTITVITPALSLPTSNTTVEVVPTNATRAKSHRELRVSQAGRVQFIVRDFDHLPDCRKVTFTANGKNIAASPLQRLLRCFAPNDRPLIERLLKSAMQECDFVFGYNPPAQECSVNREHLKRELRKLLTELLAEAAAPTEDGTLQAIGA